MMRKSQDIYIQEMENNIQKKELNIRDNYEKINLYNKEKNFFKLKMKNYFHIRLILSQQQDAF